MSWKATAYVKTITENITAAEKLLLFVLSDYYNDHQEVAWPSIARLAEESLLSERQAQRLLADLETKGFLSRTSRRGRKTTQYSFPALIGQDVLSKSPDKTFGDVRPDISDASIGHSYVTQTVEQVKQQTLSSSPTVPNEVFNLNSEPPSNGNGNRKKNCDPRHAPFKVKLERFWKYLNPEIDLAWSGSEAGQLAIFLRKWPKLTLEEFHCWLDNYCHSEGIVDTKTPREFLPFLHQYAKESLDQFRKPMQEARR